MNNNRVPLGPAPVADPERWRRLSTRQADTLDELRRHQRPQPIARIADALGLHPNTAREHLDALVDAGLASRTQAAAAGRGRPAWLYAAEESEPDAQLRDYAGLAIALAGHLQQTGTDPAAEALGIGVRWGRELAEQGSHPPGRPDQQAVDLLAGLGFDPTPRAVVPGAAIALRRCPLLDAARRYPDVVCRVHLGIVRGALEAFGGEPARSDLLPFADPGSCRLMLDANVTRVPS